MELQQLVRDTVKKYRVNYDFACNCPYISPEQVHEAFLVLQEARKLLQNPAGIVEFQHKYELLEYWN